MLVVAGEQCKVGTAPRNAGLPSVSNPGANSLSLFVTKD
jgi:hypothetical protein